MVLVYDILHDEVSLDDAYKTRMYEYLYILPEMWHFSCAPFSEGQLAVSATASQGVG